MLKPLFTFQPYSVACSRASVFELQGIALSKDAGAEQRSYQFLNDPKTSLNRTNWHITTFKNSTRLIHVAMQTMVDEFGTKVKLAWSFLNKAKQSCGGDCGSCFTSSGPVQEPYNTFPRKYAHHLHQLKQIPMESIYTSRTLKFTLLTLFQHDTCSLQRIGLTRPFCLAGAARSDFHTRLDL